MRIGDSSRAGRCRAHSPRTDPIAPMTDLHASPLGHATTYADAYDPALLFPVERAPQRAELGLGGALPFRGVDIWTAYELSWLDPAGKPQVAIATFAVPADSPRDRRVEVGQALPRLRSTRRASPTRPRWRARSRATSSAATGAPVERRADAARGVRRARRTPSSPASRLDDAAVRRRRCGAAAGRARRRRPGGRGDAAHAALPLGVPGHRPARLRQRADPLPRAADRSRRPAALPRLVSPPPGLPRALRRADLRRRPAPRCRPRGADRPTRASPAAAASTSIRCAAPATSRRRANRAHGPPMSATAPARRRALRGAAITFRRRSVPGADGRARCGTRPTRWSSSRDGRIVAFGPAAERHARAAAGRAGDPLRQRAARCRGSSTRTSTIPQLPIIAACGKPLLDWLDHYTFVAEQRFADPAFAAATAEVFLDECLRQGMTTAAVYGTVHPQSVDGLFRGGAAPRPADDRRQGADGPQRAGRAARHRAERLRRLARR